ncbi:MAG: GNAT family N-acetyltransferase [Gammaproteobacteria bacterium]|nr:GNAT family N-acetyltransferase [Gammaproteobacteria bacterium]
MEIRELVHDSEEYRRVVSLRSAILRQPLGLAYSAADLASERDQLHLAGFIGDAPVATIILQPLPEGVGKLRQMAVSAADQRKGLGTRLLLAVEQLARSHGLKLLILHARESALPFYLKAGYTAVGERFTEVGLPHWRMEKTLTDA